MDGWEIALEIHENLYRSGEGKGVAKLSNELGYDHAVIRSELT